MTRYYYILIFVLFPICLIAQTDCVDFLDYDSSQDWIRELNKLESNARKDSILNWIQCERILGKENVKFNLTCIFDGLIAIDIPKDRDKLLRNIDSQNMQLINSLCETEGIYPEKCNLGFLLVSGLDKPIVDNTNKLTVKKIERKKGKITIKIKAIESCIIKLKIEDFCSIDNIKNDKRQLKKGSNRIVVSGDNELKLISFNDNEIVIIK